jgi:hypothetical protein
MPGNGNGGNGGISNISSGAGGFGTGMWVSTGEGGQEWRPSSGGGIAHEHPEDTEPPPHVPVIREARNVQKANIDRSSLYDPTQTTQALGRDYLQQRNASNPQPLGSTGAGAVGYDFTPSEERLY